MKDWIKKPWPFYDEDEISAVSTVLRNGKVNYWTGEEVKCFEKEFADFIGCKHAVAVSNGTLALELAIHSLGIGNGDEVIVTPRTFIASASCAILNGAKPLFADIDPESQNITAKTIEMAITSRTKAIIAVHLAGWPCNMDSIIRLAKKHYLKVIEDCAQAHGARYKGKIVGSFGHVAAFSFCQDKIISTGGEGGMLTTNDHNIWKIAWSYKDQGKSHDTVFNKKHPPGFRWLHASFGTNCRMTEIQASIGRIQLRKLPEWLKIRRNNAIILTKRFSTIAGLRVTNPPDYIEHAYYKYYVFIRPQLLKPGWNRNRIMVEINKHGIPCTVGSCSEIYLEKAFEGNGLRPRTRLKVAKELGETSLMFRVHPTLTINDMEKTADVVETVMSQASRSA